MTSGVPVPLCPPRFPSPPLTGWEVVTSDSVKDIAPRCPVVTSGRQGAFALLHFTLTASIYDRHIVFLPCSWSWLF